MVLMKNKTESFIKNDMGLSGITGIDNSVLCCTSQQLELFTAHKFKYREEVFGLKVQEVFSSSESVDIYCNNNKIAHRNKVFSGFEPCVHNNIQTYAFFHKKPVFEDDGITLMGTFYQGFVLYENSVINCIRQLDQYRNTIFNSEGASFLEIYKQDHQFQLTTRESECLFYTIRGKTAKEAARILNISPKTVEFHIEHLKCKFNCFSKSELIAKSIEHGYLNKIPQPLIRRILK